jgi:hypothetical protein
MAKPIFRDNLILEVYQPTESGNVDPKRPPRGGSAVMPSLAKLLAKKKSSGQPTPRPALDEK